MSIHVDATRFIMLIQEQGLCHSGINKTSTMEQGNSEMLKLVSHGSLLLWRFLYDGCI